MSERRSLVRQRTRDAGWMALAVAALAGVVAAPVAVAGPIHGTCYQSAAGQCRIRIDPFTVDVPVGERLGAVQVTLNDQSVYDFRTDVSNPPASYTLSPPRRDLAARCGEAYVIRYLAQVTPDQTFVVAGETGPVTCPTFLTTTTTSSTTTTLPGSDHPIPLASVLVKPAKVFRFAAKGSVVLPEGDPTVLGGALALTGSVGSLTRALPAACWKPLGRRTVKGFECVESDCKVLVKVKSIKGRCRIDGDDFGPLPEPEPVDVVLTVATTRYCGRCGGIAKGNPEKKLKRKRCEGPPSCP